MTMKTKNMEGGVWRMVAAMGLSGTIGLFVLMSGQSTQTVVFFRCLIGAAALLAWLTYQRAWQPLDAGKLRWLALGGVALIVNWLCLFSAFRLSNISIATVVYHMQPFFLILLAALSNRELPDWNKMPWLVLAFAGVAMTSGVDFGGGQHDLMQGVVLALTAAFFYALATLATKKLSGVPPAQIAGLQLILGIVALAPLADFSTAFETPRSWIPLLILGLVHTGFMYNLMYAAFQRLPATMIATLSFIYPLAAIIVDKMFFQTVLSLAQMLGMLFILIAVVANQRAWSLNLRLLGLAQDK
jgi:drug/metabolite transporter (DMT)-like permease